jgi:hypothetical protein
MRHGLSPPLSGECSQFALMMPHRFRFDSPRVLLAFEVT